MMKVHVLGGFLGAGKTTLARALAGYLADRGERVAVVTNDQGRSLVDTSLCGRTAQDVREVSGGCFCCRYDDLEAALLASAEAGATVAIAEAVGSCTDLVATVVAPLADRHPGRLRLAPLAVVVDPWRAIEIAEGRLPADVGYLFAKQIEEADVVLVSRADLDPPDIGAAIRAIRADVPVIAVSGTTGAGVSDWLAARPERLAAPLEIDYERYAGAEALLGWCNGRVRIAGEEPFAPAEAMRRFLTSMSGATVAHVKVTSVDPAGGRGSVVRAGDPPVVDASDLPALVRSARWLINARVAVAPDVLLAQVRAALEAAVRPARVEWEELEAFSPSRPVPRHRYALRGGCDAEAACCAAFYDRDDVRALLGDSWHPGGVDLTLSMAERLALEPGARILDVACGKGTSLRAVLDRWPAHGVGLDARAQGSDDGRSDLEIRRGDAHAIPFEDGSFDAMLCECALSTFFDQPGALAEMHRVLRPGARLALSDMAVDGPLPEDLQQWVHTGTCLARALSEAAAIRALEDAGFVVVERWDASSGLRELLHRIKRGLVGAAFATATRQLPDAARFDARHARRVLEEAERAVAGGTIRYLALLAERPA